MVGQHELPLTKQFMREHGEKKSQMKVSWAEYLKILQTTEVQKR